MSRTNRWTEGKGRWGLIYTLLCIKKLTNENLLYSTGNPMFCGEISGKEIQKRGDICVQIAD